jgi:hypothetical protein
VKALYTLGTFYLLFSLSLLFSDVVFSTKQAQQPVVAPRTNINISGNSWFEQIRPHCNAVEIDTHLRSNPPPEDLEGKAYAAACYGLAGKIEEARALINGLPPGNRAYAAGVVFNVGHPIADAGDDRSAGPMMRLTIEYQPGNYMALYHAGISEHILGQNELSQIHLLEFLKLYHADDYYTRKAREVLKLLEQ